MLQRKSLKNTYRGHARIKTLIPPGLQSPPWQVWSFWRDASLLFQLDWFHHAVYRVLQMACSSPKQPNSVVSSPLIMQSAIRENPFSSSNPLITQSAIREKNLSSLKHPLIMQSAIRENPFSLIDWWSLTYHYSLLSWADSLSSHMVLHEWSDL